MGLCLVAAGCAEWRVGGCTHERPGGYLFRVFQALPDGISTQPGMGILSPGFPMGDAPIGVLQPN